jgi:hypothetical protein
MSHTQKKYIYSCGCGKRGVQGAVLGYASQIVGAEVGLMIQPYDIARQTKQEKNVTNENVKS